MHEVLSRRSLLEIAALAAVVPVTASVGGCSSTPTPASGSNPSSTDPRPAGKVLLAYFSRAGENYYYGGRTQLEVGNTEVLARMIASMSSVDLYEIVPEVDYSADYDATVERNVREQHDDARPAIAGELPDLSEYCTVILASPIWNVRPPMIMHTFIDGVALQGLTVHPVVTYAVSGLGSAVDEYTRALPESSTVGEPLAVQGERVADARLAVCRWLRASGLRSG
ncbi:flavodoxin [Gordonia sp. Z-3]|uniref:flavodoxin n=1 Tax=Gordonia sp. Z-3 TaxID=3115408 RepID=UPI002E2C8483|nr:flavodoxin [Gordonia sp. Z-3]MED5802752.1 flavodoxin [Gordonia sp. Z-3]